jgi:hypothetical protein
VVEHEFRHAFISVRRSARSTLCGVSTESGRIAIL